MSDETGDGRTDDGTERTDGTTAADGGWRSDAPDFDDGRRHDWPGDPDWPVRESVVEYETGWQTAGYDLVEHPDGSTKRYYWTELATAVVVVARAGDDLLMVEQYRPTVRNTQLELPAGIVEAGESYTEAGRRELREETGFDAAGVSLLGEVQCTTGLLRHTRGFVFAEGLEPVGREPDDNEYLVPRSVPVEEAPAVVRSPPTNDATLEGVLLAREEGLL
ncbi:NUDIX hydrolase [Halobacteriales archaeon QS_6_71_20]|nr:MAG: NUDIX hydrolase [Halobacteriales archaeon QS_6_71_20]